MKIAFHIFHFSFRGSEIAAFDYAYYNQKILNNVSFIVIPEKQKIPQNNEVFNKFNKEFDILFYKDNIHLEELCKLHKIDGIYFIKYGTKGEIIINSIPSFVHCVFTTTDKHGTVYAGVSDSVSKHNNQNIKYPVLNHIVYLPELKSNLRKILGIPDGAIVLGRHGGEDTFNIDYLRDIIKSIVEVRKDIYFLFAVRPYILKDVNHKQIIYLDSFSDNRVKRKFINTCDAMIHACGLGESFGLSILEFIYCNKPVITWNGGSWHKQHLENLGNNAVTYENKEELFHILSNLKKEELVVSKNFTQEVKQKYSPIKIIGDFKNLFLDKIQN